jgi:hypothetical protein
MPKYNARVATSTISVSPVRRTISNNLALKPNVSYNSQQNLITPNKIKATSRAEKVELKLVENDLNDGASLAKTVVIILLISIVTTVSYLGLNTWTSSISLESALVQSKIDGLSEEIEATNQSTQVLHNVETRARQLGMVDRGKTTFIEVKKSLVSQVMNADQIPGSNSHETVPTNTSPLG